MLADRTFLGAPEVSTSAASKKIVSATSDMDDDLLESHAATNWGAVMVTDTDADTVDNAIMR